MRTVICHFFNEAYLLPWWLRHHRALFDWGILIDHGSTDASADIVREMVPSWRLVRSRLKHFDAYLTDLEVMGYEQEIGGWKIVLTVTEFLMPTMPLQVIERELEIKGRMGCSASGILVVDHQPTSVPTSEVSLPIQKHWGVDDNSVLQTQQRLALGLPEMPYRNRFFHRAEVGMYHPGRHSSYHPDFGLRLLDLMIFHFGYAPWNEHGLLRKLQIANKLSPEDVQRGWGSHHTKKAEELQRDYESIRPNAVDLNTHPYASRAIAYAGSIYT